MNKITKDTFVRLVQENITAKGEKVTLKDTKLFADAVFSVFAEQTALGNPITIPGVFTTKATEKEERVAINPQNGEEVVVEAHTRMSVALAGNLKKVSK